MIKPQRMWTMPEIGKLRELYPDENKDAIAQILNRSSASIQHMAFKLGIKKSPEYQSKAKSHKTKI